MHAEKVAIIGCGWLGYRLAQFLKNSFEIHTTVTTGNKMATLEKEGFHPEMVNFEINDPGGYWKPWHKLSMMDHIIITVPLFSKRVDEQVLNTRITNISSFLSPFKGTIILMSSIGVYKGFTGDVTEEFLPAESCKGEKEIKQLFDQATILRLGGLMGDDRLLSRYTIADREAPVNHVHFMDICRVVQILIANSISSRVYNLLAPLHPSKEDVINAQHDQFTVSLPAKESKRVLSQKIIYEMGYQFLYPDPRYFHLPPGSGHQEPQESIR